jgi:NAD(P)-dependent dehydrogenase (short-subunit alcohol dehydrogenase family)
MHMNDESGRRQPMGDRVEGKVAVVIGGGGAGIGGATAKTLGREGAEVVVAGHTVADIEQVAADIRGSGGSATASFVELSDEESIRTLFSDAVQRYGRVDVAFTSAILKGDSPARDRSITETDTDDWRRILEVDLIGTMLVCKYAVNAMLNSGGGSIINTTSNSSLAGDLTLAAYGAAKAGVNTLTKYVATAYGKDNIRCNAISPASIAGPGYRASVPPEVVNAFLENTVLLPSLGVPQDIANAALFLASDESSFITGQVIQVDGGGLSHLPHVGFLRRNNLTTTVGAPRTAASSD